MLRFGEGFSRCFKKGTTILIFSPNSLAFPVVALGALSAGLVVTTANPAYKPGELVYQIQDSGSSIILAVSELVDVAKEALRLSGLSPDALYLLPGAEGKIGTGAKSYLELRGNEGFTPFVIQDKKRSVACEHFVVCWSPLP